MKNFSHLETLKNASVGTYTFFRQNDHLGVHGYYLVYNVL